MKPSTSKPISSPGRTDKYPPPLMRFLRSNVGSRSRGRSRASPLFMRRKRTTANSSTTAIEAQQEPSSPKVTCIGQVRVRRSSSGSSKSKPAGIKKGTPSRRHSSSSNAGAGNRFCYWVGKPPALCDSFHVTFCRRRPPGCFRPRWRKWVSFFHCRNVCVRTDSLKKGSNPMGSSRIDSDSDEIGRQRDEDQEEEEEDQEFGPRHSLSRVYESDVSTTPPKNALLLTRCRSAPHRSSYLASRSWGSPLRKEEEEKETAGERETGEQENRESTAEEEVEELASSEIGQIRRDSAAESRIDREWEGKLEIRKEEAVVEAERGGDSNKAETTTTTMALTTQNAVEGEKQRERERNEEGPVMLTRCKSEPARSSGDPLTSSFWRERRLESTVSCTHSVESK